MCRCVLRTSEGGSWRSATCTVPEGTSELPLRPSVHLLLLQPVGYGWEPVPAEKAFPTRDPFWHKVEPLEATEESVLGSGKVGMSISWQLQGAVV